MKITGKMSVFGGPKDKGVTPSEGLALIEPSDLKLWWFRYLFLSKQPKDTTGLARRLNPDVYYVACRWDYEVTSREKLRWSIAKLTANNKTIFVRPVDWGPNIRTKRVADLSPKRRGSIGFTNQ